jgi:hypothetical protein
MQRRAFPLDSPLPDQTAKPLPGSIHFPGTTAWVPATSIPVPNSLRKRDVRRPCCKARDECVDDNHLCQTFSLRGRRKQLVAAKILQNLQRRKLGFQNENQVS